MSQHDGPAAHPDGERDEPTDAPAGVATAGAPDEPAPALRLAVRVGRLTVRALTGAAALAVTAAAVAAGQVLVPVDPLPVPLTRVAVPPADTQLVCPGPLRLPTEPEPGGDVAYDPQFDPAPAAAVSTLGVVSAEPFVADAVGPAPATLRGLTAPDPLLELVGSTAGPRAAVGALADVATATVVDAGPAGSATAWAAGAIGVTTLQGDLRGLAAAGCQRPTAEAWLVGGSTSLGSSARLVLQNPGRTPAIVEIALWGPAGPVELAGAPDYLVPAGEERVVLLEGVAAEQRRVVVRLAASGGLVTGYLQDSAIRGLVPAGVDYVLSSAEPATRQVVPGLSVTAAPAGGADTALLRLLAPEGSGTATVSLLGPQGAVALPGAAEVRLEAGTVLDVPLGGLPAGDYTVVVDSPVPVVAAAMLTRGAGVGAADEATAARSPLDRAWARSVVPGSSGAIAVPEGLDGRLDVAVVPQPGLSGTASATLRVIGVGGRVLAEHEVTLRLGATTSWPLAALGSAALNAAPAADAARPTAVVLSTADPRVTWAAVLEAPDRSEGLISVLTPVPPGAPQPEVSVLVR